MGDSETNTSTSRATDSVTSSATGAGPSIAGLPPSVCTQPSIREFAHSMKSVPPRRAELYDEQLVRRAILKLPATPQFSRSSADHSNAPITSPAADAEQLRALTAASPFSRSRTIQTRQSQRLPPPDASAYAPPIAGSEEEKMYRSCQAALMILHLQLHCNRRRASAASVDALTAAVDISVSTINDSRRLLSSTGSTYKTADAAHNNCSRRLALAAAVDRSTIAADARRRLQLRLPLGTCRSCPTMEPKILKYLRSKIERISEENENKTKSLQPSTKRRSSVTLLDSSSYDDQNKDLRIFNTFDDKFNSDPKTITNYEEYDEESQKKDNVKSMDKPTKILELEEHEQNTKNPNNVDQVIAKHMAQDTVIEMSDKIRTDNFMSEDEDFVWDSTSWEGTDESLSDDDDQPKKRKKVNVEDGKVGESDLDITAGTNQEEISDESSEEFTEENPTTSRDNGYKRQAKSQYKGNKKTFYRGGGNQRRNNSEGRLSKFEALYDIFDALQMEIELASANPEDEYVERNQIEERYHSLIASARSQLRTSGSQRKGSETGTTMDSKPGFIEKLHEGVCVCNRKYTDTNTNKSKTAAWQTVMKRFNELNSRQRELAEIKQQWRTMKLDAKKNMSQNSESQLDLGTQEFVVTEVDNRDTAKENIIPLRKPQTTLNNRVSSVNCHLVMDIDQLL
ncbi:hypothetical protein HW555_013824 [Spodoptera exigua]|uniref:Regulatory protein zeste n=1 Tax=Spodoptera exigua TaxID=7107 RepID=A0A835G4L9_SPOEX|nr:hypothetical protein HW555_013824 [Spodoptera exigua]